MLQVVDQLQQKRVELANATTTLSEAERLLDTDRVIAEKQRVEVLRGFISRLETEAREELEHEGQRRAKTWLKKTTKEVASAGQKISAAQDVVRDKLKGVVEAIKAEAEVRASVEQFALADEVLAARFGLARSFTRMSVSLPDLQDWVMPVLLATDSMRRYVRWPRGLLISTQASDTPEMRRRNAVKAVHEFLQSKRDTTLPPEVQAILLESPISPDVLETPEERRRREASEAVIGTGKVDPHLAQAATETLALSKLGVPSGGVHRG